MVVLLGASDLHLVASSYAQIRLNGDLIALDEAFFSPQNLAHFPELVAHSGLGEIAALGVLGGEATQNLISSLLRKEQWQEFQARRELDMSLDFGELVGGELIQRGRFRANFYFAQGAMAAAFRAIPAHVPTLDELGLPAILKDFTKRQSGLVLVTGATGSGKSTTLAAMLNEINQTQHKHILTIEDPVEFVHRSAKSLFSQRNVGADTFEFKNALKFALRQDPDVILVGEMRDAETIETAIAAAETGHLVFATLHTSSAVGSINRIVESFEGAKQSLIRSMLSQSLVAVISQRLEKCGAGGGGASGASGANSNLAGAGGANLSLNSNLAGGDSRDPRARNMAKNGGANSGRNLAQNAAQNPAQNGGLNGAQNAAANPPAPAANAAPAAVLGKQKRICLQEILINNSAISNLIREGALHQIQSAMQLGAKDGMQTMQLARERAQRAGLLG